MAFIPAKKPQQFADLKAILAQSKDSDNAIYQTVNVLLDRLGQFGGTGATTGAQGPSGPVGPSPALLETFVTVNTEPTLANHRKLVAGTNVTLNTSTPGSLIVNASGTGGSGGGMEYLGDFTSGPIYNDGDIVIGADGIAYVCTVDGTTTPPEPWPGGGIAVNATVDATYWVVSGHAALTNERVMSALANGYVKSTAGEPSTVAIIPVSEGGTSANNPTDARTNLGVGTVGPIDLNGDANTYLNGSGNWTAPPVASGIPTGAIILMTVPCPPGYTRMAGWDGRYVRMGPTHVTGGTGSHSHGVGSYASQAHTHAPGTLESPSHSHGDGSYVVDSHAHGAGTLEVASHTHSLSVSVSVSGTTGSAGDHDHSVSGTTGGESNGSAVMDAGGGMNCVRAPHTHSFSANTTTDGSHSHSFSDTATASGTSGSSNPDVAGTTANATAGVSGTSSSAGPFAITGVSATSGPLAITGASDSRANDPLYTDFYACRKD